MAIQIKATVQYFPVVPFVTRSFESVWMDEIPTVDHSNEIG